MTTHVRFIRAGALFVCAAALSAFSATRAAAQASSVMVTGAAAKRAATNGEISGDAATKMAQACQDFAAAHGFSASIFVLDPFGDIVHSHRMDGAKPDEISQALNRAKAALFNRGPSGNANPNNPNANPVGIVRTMMRGEEPTPGGLTFVMDNQVLGAIGVSGSDSLNVDCARAAIAAVPGLSTPAPPAGPAPAAAAPAQPR